MPSTPTMTSDEIIQEASRILLQESNALADCAERLRHENKDQFHQAIYRLFQTLDRGGKIVVTGVGKSGKIGEKIVATLQSTGSCAVFLHPVEGIHGDLGVIQANDAVIAISYSGNTEEVLRLMPSLRKRNVSVIALCGNKNSRLVKESDIWLDGHVKSEACQYIPAPTTSTTLALALGDAVAITLMELRGFTPQSFALNHPGGSLGRRLLLKVKDIMYRISDVLTVFMSTKMDRVVAEMMDYKCNSVALVIDDSGHSVVGVITSGDIRRAIAFRGQFFELNANDVMSRNPVTCFVDDLAGEAKRLMEESDYPISTLPVVDKNNKVKGLLTFKQLEELI
ncbi:1374_t:CDS:1 [Paraglomus brasilianum]|uniref:1374_t:CDS:1 n=1 Tax=Paraglomus brasilianum TaxID=144538 RepID=A0A9N8ZJD2_9GLOM|nr:1374_t:CDS:1 [Paraglomus brasilianum]